MYLEEEIKHLFLKVCACVALYEPDAARRDFRYPWFFTARKKNMQNKNKNFRKDWEPNEELKTYNQKLN